jgi:hypothetical protein
MSFPKIDAAERVFVESFKATQTPISTLNESAKAAAMAADTSHDELLSLAEFDAAKSSFSDADAKVVGDRLWTQFSNRLISGIRTAPEFRDSFSGSPPANRLPIDSAAPGYAGAATAVPTAIVGASIPMGSFTDAVNKPEIASRPALVTFLNQFNMKNGYVDSGGNSAPMTDGESLNWDKHLSVAELYPNRATIERHLAQLSSSDREILQRFVENAVTGFVTAVPYALIAAMADAKP